MPHELLEEIRLLGNIETQTTKLLNIVLTGQPELAHRLNDASLRQLKQRIALRCELQPLTFAESAAYISGRLRIAGGTPEKIFTREAVLRIHEASMGIPRTINVMCDNALIGGFAAQVKPITRVLVEDVCQDFDLAVAAESAAAPPLSTGQPQPEAAATRTSVATPTTSEDKNRPAPARPARTEEVKRRRFF